MVKGARHELASFRQTSSWPTSALIVAGAVKVAVAQIGARMHYAVPRILHEHGMLTRLFTDFYVGNKPAMGTLVGLLNRKAELQQLMRLLSRVAEGIPPRRVTSFDLAGMLTALQLSFAKNETLRTEVFARTNAAFCRRVVGHGIGDADAVWAFNGAGLEIFENARSNRKRCLLEQTIAPLCLLADIINEEAERWADWLESPQAKLDLSTLAQREEREWQLADAIICGSEFVAERLRASGVANTKCFVVPYGISRPTRANLPHRRGHERLRVLFAGEVGLRKGAPYLLEALKVLGPRAVDARFAGRIALSSQKLSAYADVAQFLGIVPRTEMLGLFKWADVLVLPSLYEGSATVVYEALLHGLPVICTPNSGAIETTGVRVVPPRDTNALCEALLVLMGPNEIMRPSRSELTQLEWQSYAARLVSAINSVGPRPSSAH